jgi:hypothetical protein
MSDDSNEDQGRSAVPGGGDPENPQDEGETSIVRGALPSLPLEECTRLLGEFGGFTWLLEGWDAWTVQEVIARLGEMMGPENTPDEDTVARWFKAFPHTLTMGRRLLASRADLIRHFAGMYLNRPRRAIAPGTPGQEDPEP